MSSYRSIPQVFLNVNFRYYRNDPLSQEEAIQDGIAGWELYESGMMDHDMLRRGLIKIGQCLNVMPTYKMLAMMTYGFDPRITGTWFPHEDQDKTIVLPNLVSMAKEQI